MKITRFIAPIPVFEDPFEVDDEYEAEVMRVFDSLSNDVQILTDILDSEAAQRIAFKVAQKTFNRQNTAELLLEYRQFIEKSFMDLAVKKVDQMRQQDEY